MLMSHWNGVEDELMVCAAAFFCNIGRDMVTPQDMKMYVSLTYRWMPGKEAESLCKMMVRAGVLSQVEGHLKPSKDILEMDVPVAYKPSEALLRRIGEFQPDDPHVPTKSRDGGQDVKGKSDNTFASLIEMAVATGMRKNEFIGSCNAIKRKVGVDIEVVALMVLRDRGVDIGSLFEEVYGCVISK